MIVVSGLIMAALIRTGRAQVPPYLDEQVEAWPLPQGLSHSAQTHCGSCGFENTVVVARVNTDSVISVITMGAKIFFIYVPRLFIVILY